MDLNRAQRDAARHKKTEAVDSILSTQKDEPVHSHQDSNKTLYRSGVVVRNDKNIGHDAIQRAREAIERVASTKKVRIKTPRLADREWFEKNRASIERTIKAPFRLDKRQSLGGDIEIVNKREQPTAPRDGGDDLASYYEMDLGSYQPHIADDEPDYVPLSER